MTPDSAHRSAVSAGPERSTLTAKETAWLAYARDVLGDEQHRQRCAALGGSPPHPGVDDPDLRWPGYLGDAAASGPCLMAVGNVHRNFASGRITAGLRDQLLVATSGWSTGEIDDADYLAATRTVYRAGLAGWTVGKHIRFAVTAFGLGTESLVYLNAARCQYPEIPPKLARASSTKVALQRLCLARFPLSDLVTALQPQAVLFSSTTAFDLAVDVRGRIAGRPAVCFHQLNGTLLRPLMLGSDVVPVKVGRSIWAPALAAAGASGRRLTASSGSGSPAT